MLDRIKGWFRRRREGEGDDDYWAGRGGRNQLGGHSPAAQEARFRSEGLGGPGGYR